MSHESDPNFYSMMLGLPEELRRPNHYQLLGLEPVSADRETIKDAAAERNGKLMTWQNSKYFKEAGRLMLELATARGVLLDPEKKLAYDQELGLITVDEEPVILVEAEPEEEPIVLQAVEEPPRAKTPAVRDSRRPRSSDVPEYLRKPPRWKRALIPSVAILLLGAIVWAGFGGNSEELEKPEPNPPAEQEIASIDDSVPPRPWQTEPSESQPESPPKPVSINREPVDVPESPLNQPASDPPPPLAKAPFDAAKAKMHQAEWAAYLNVPEETANSLGMKLCLIPPGEFQMGSPEDERGRKGEELLHRVKITKAFYAGVYEVTMKEFTELLSRTLPLSLQSQLNESGAYPITRLTWFDAIEFCNALSEKEGLAPYYELKLKPAQGSGKPIKHAEVTVLGGEGYRLPTEAEWEFACRAGTTTRTNAGDTVPADYRDKFESAVPLTRVGKYQPNSFGLFDMHGNAGEWCFDIYDRSYYHASRIVDPVCTDLPSGSRMLRVYRGGSHTHLEENCRSATRMFTSPEDENSRRGIGFRVLRNVKHPHSQRAIVGNVSQTTVEDQPSLAKIPFDAEQAAQHQAAWAKHLNVPTEATNKAGMKLRLIPPGEFQMGSPIDEMGRRSEELVHPVKFTKAYYLGVNEVTLKNFIDVLNDGALLSGMEPRYKLAYADLPVEGVTWFDCVNFCNQLSQQEGFPPYYKLTSITKGNPWSIRSADIAVLGGPGYRLPSEAEWEFACRAGTETATHFGDELLSARQGLFRAPNNGTAPRPKPVGSYPPNAFGLFDMHSNVGEWCQDYFDRDFYRNSPVNNPLQTKPPPGPKRDFRVIRSGGYKSVPLSSRSAARTGWRESSSLSTGFRVARTPEAE